MNRIILVGNGFDLAHNVPTSYKDFINWYWEERWERMVSSRSLVDDDNLCYLKLKPGIIYKSWKEYDSYNHLGHRFSASERIDFVKKDNGTCEFKPLPLLSAILQSVDKKGWVDIENEYYKILVSTKHKNGDRIEFLSSLNNQLGFLREKLTEYLSSLEYKISDSDESVRMLRQQLLQPISPNDIAVSSHALLNDFIEARAEYDDDTWAALLGRYNQCEVYSRMCEAKSVAEKVKSQKAKGQRTYTFKEYELENFMVPEKILLLNFNYTTIADGYMPREQIFKVNHIHGVLSDRDCVIFGYGDELDKDYQTLRDANENEYLRNIKSVKYLESDNYRKLLEFMSSAPYQIYIMGHSCGNSDRTLLNTLFEHENCVSIKPFYYAKYDGTDNYLDIIQNISRNFTDMKIMRDRVVNKKFCMPLPQMKVIDDK